MRLGKTSIVPCIASTTIAIFMCSSVAVAGEGSACNYSLEDGFNSLPDSGIISESVNSGSADHLDLSISWKFNPLNAPLRFYQARSRYNKLKRVLREECRKKSECTGEDCSLRTEAVEAVTPFMFPVVHRVGVMQLTGSGQFSYDCECEPVSSSSSSSSSGGTGSSTSNSK